MQVSCEHCGNVVYAAHGDTGIVDEVLKRAGWRMRRRTTGADRSLDIAAEVAEDLRDLGLDTSDSDVAAWLEEDAARFAEVDRVPAPLRAAAEWLERKEGSVTPLRRDVLEKLTASTVQRSGITWLRTPEGRLACSVHCFEQLEICDDCGIPRTAEVHRGCQGFVPKCNQHRPRADRR